MRYSQQCFDIAKRGYDNTSRVLTFLECYLDDPDYLVWGEIIARLNTLKFVWKKHPIVKNKINTFLLGALKPHLLKLGWDFSKDDTYQTMKMRQLVISTLAGIGEASVLDTCRRCFKNFIEEPASNSIDPNIRQSVFVSVVRFSETGGEELEKLEEIYSDIESTEIRVEILKALGSTKDVGHLKRSLDFAFTSGHVRTQNMVYILTSTDDDNSFDAWTYVTENWGKILETFGKGGMGLLHYLVCAPLAGLLDPDEIEQAKEFIESHTTDVSSISNGCKSNFGEKPEIVEMVWKG